MEKNEQFMHWLNKIQNLNPNPEPVKPKSVFETPQDLERVENKNSADYDAYREYAKILRQLEFHKVRNDVQKYDEERSKLDKTFKDFHFNCENEVDKSEQNKELDLVLENIYMKKLEIDIGPDVVSETVKKELTAQEIAFQERQRERAEQEKKIRDLINNFDKKNKGNDGTAKSFEEICKENDTLDETEQQVESDMDISLKIRLDSYDQTKESNKQKARRMEQLKGLQKKMDSDRRSKGK